MKVKVRVTKEKVNFVGFLIGITTKHEWGIVVDRDGKIDMYPVYDIKVIDLGFRIQADE